jgi:SAM-dependent methyltransferase
VRYDEAAYGDAYADSYDDLQGPLNRDQAVAFIRQLVRPGSRVFELGIGTGRVALPLAAAGLEVFGCDISAEMIGVLKSKTGTLPVQAYVGDMSAGPQVEGSLDLAYSVFGTLACVVDQARQAATIAAVAAKLAPGGYFLAESELPDLASFSNCQKVEVGHLDQQRVMISCHTLDLPAQLISSQHVVVDNGQVRTIPILFRYIWPAELDLMCHAAGLELVGRWSDFRRSPITPADRGQVALYRKPGGSSEREVEVSGRSK